MYTLPARGQSEQILVNQGTIKSIQTKRYQDGELVFFALVVDNYALDDVDALVENGLYYLDFDGFIRAADFAIELQAQSENLQYKGWWSKQENTFSLRVAQDNAVSLEGSDTVFPTATVSWNGNDVKVADGQLISQDNQIYVRADVLGQWFYAQFEFNEEKLQVTANTRQDWPFQLLQKRQNARVSSLRQRPDAQEPLYDPGYALLSPQAIDFQLTARATQLGTENARESLSYSVLGRNDILGVSSRYFATGNSNESVAIATADFSKNWFNGEKGPLGITGVQFGDIQSVRVGTNSNFSTRGVKFGNTVLDKQTNQEQTNIAGFVQSGWDVELYHNDVLVNQLFNISSGRYEFLDITLFSGVNTFEVKKYGPQGQVQTETFERVVDSSLANQLATSYEVSLTQNNTDLFGVQNIPSEQDDNFALAGRYGISVGESSSINFAHQNQLGASQLSDEYLLGFSTKVGQASIFNANFRHIDKQSQGLELLYRTTAAGQMIVVNSDISKNLSSDEGESYFGTARLIVSGNIFSYLSHDVFHQTQGQVQQNFLGDKIYSFQNRLNYRTSRFSLNHFLDYQLIEQKLGEKTDFLRGTLNTNFNLGDVNARAGGTYNVEQTIDWETFFFNANWYAFDRASLRGEFIRNLNLKANTYSLSVDWQHELYSLNARVEHSDLFDTSVSLNARISFAEAPTEFGYIQSRRSLAESGTVLVRVYHDVNNNGVYDADDIAVDNAKVSAVQSRRFEKTDAIGIAQLDGLSSFRQSDLIVDLDSLNNYLLVHSTQKTSITPRAGLVTLVNYPMVEASEIDGEVTFIDQYGRSQLLTNVPLFLQDSFGNKIASIRAGLDGYFYHTGLVPHTYYLGVDEEYLNKKNFESFSPVKIEIKEQAEQIVDLQLTLQKKLHKNGFIAMIGKFNTQRALTIFHHSVVKEIPTLTQLTGHPLFLVTPEMSNEKYSLGLAYTDNKEQADKICELLRNITDDCSVVDYEIFL